MYNLITGEKLPKLVRENQNHAQIEDMQQKLEALHLLKLKKV
jgi:hypothetical protein